jgi:hypothetical protein
LVKKNRQKAGGLRFEKTEKLLGTRSRIFRFEFWNALCSGFLGKAVFTRGFPSQCFLDVFGKAGCPRTFRLKRTYAG